MSEDIERGKFGIQSYKGKKVRNRKLGVKPPTFTSKNSLGVNLIQFHEIQRVVRIGMMNGHKKTTILNKLKSELNLKGLDYEKAYSLGVKYYQERIVTRAELPVIVNEHILLYEQIYEFFNELNSTQLKLKALQAKERLVGLHKSELVINIEEEEEKTIQKEGYDFKLLTDKEQQRFEFLLKKLEKKRK
jgi:hypothetical protein